LGLPPFEFFFFTASISLCLVVIAVISFPDADQREHTASGPERGIRVFALRKHRLP
jgi:hypothetical protein